MSGGLVFRPRPGALVAALAAAGLPPFEAGSPEDARRLAAALRQPREPRPIREVADASADGVPVRVYRDAEAPAATLVFFHGGGWVLGGLDEADPLMRDLAVATGCRFVSVDYRLAPETRFPGALEDADRALAWAVAEFGAPLLVMGESAGGNIATVATMRARDDGGPAIAGQILAYPVTDAAMAGGSYATYAEGPLLTAPLMAWFWDHYIPDPAARAHPHASPLRGDLAGLPRAFVITAEHDVLRDEGEAYAAALAAAGVPMRLERYGGQIHSFLALDLLDADDTVLQDIREFINTTIGVTP